MSTSSGGGQKPDPRAGELDPRAGHPDLGADILYSACWEDLAVARECLRMTPSARVVAIASAGDNALGLLLDDPAHVLAVDLNPAQVALVRLKAAAMRLPPGDAAAFLGAEGRPDRLATYAALRPALDPGAASFWDRRTSLIEAGVIHAGRFERYLATFRRLVLPIVPGRRVVEAILASDDPVEQARLYRREWDSPAWRGIFRLLFGRRMLAGRARHAAFFAHAPEIDVGAHYLERLEAGITAMPAARNPYLALALSGRYRPPDALPDYLRPDRQGLISARLDRLEVRTMSLLEALRGLPDRSVDAFYLSDVFELVDARTHEATLAEVARVGRPGARACYWSNLVERHRPPSMADRLRTHEQLAARLLSRDRAFLYSGLAIEEVVDGSVQEVGSAA